MITPNYPIQIVKCANGFIVHPDSYHRGEAFCMEQTMVFTRLEDLNGWLHLHFKSDK